MRLRERLNAINAVTDGLLVLSEQDADYVLTMSGASRTPSRWDDMPHDERRSALLARLGQEPDVVIERLYPSLSPEASAMVDAVAADLFSRDREEASFILQQAGVERLGALKFWDSLPAGARKSYILMLLRRNDAEVVENLHELIEPNPEPAQPAQLAEEPPDAPEDPPAPAAVAAAVDDAGPIFIVHGHAHGLLYETQIVLERATGREVVVLHQKANSGKTLIEKFEDEAAKAAFAVVLLTADDEGGAKADEGRRPRGRQNVIFELGFFYAKLGRNRVAVLVDRDVEEPSDLRGLVYIPIDQGGGWKQRLSKELASAGIPFDWSNVP